MTKLRILILLAVVIPLFTFPGVVSAQAAELPHMFYGSASVDGTNAPAGTSVTAQIDGKDVASSTYTGTRYSLTVSAPIGQSFKDKTITFKVGTATATNTAKHIPGDVTILNLAATTAPPVPPGPPTITLTPTTGVVSSVMGTNFTANSAVTVSAGTTTLASSMTDGKGVFLATIVAPDQTKAGKVTITAVDASKIQAIADLNVPDLKGKDGAAGPAGPAGAAGTAGSAGTAGPEGKTGPAGPQGPAGTAGYDGKTGAAGSDGKVGPAGPAGADGKDAPMTVRWATLLIAVLALVLSLFLLFRKQRAVAEPKEIESLRTRLSKAERLAGLKRELIIAEYETKVKQWEKEGYDVREFRALLEQEKKQPGS